MTSLRTTADRAQVPGDRPGPADLADRSGPFLGTERGSGADATQVPGDDRRFRTPAPWCAAVGLGLLLAGLAGGGPVLVLLGLVASTTSLATRRMPLDLAVTVAVTALLVVAVLAGLGASAAGVDLLARPWLLSAAYVALAAGAVVVSLTRRPTGTTARPRPRVRRLAYLPVTLPVATALAQVAVPGLTKSWAFWSTDLARQMVALQGVQAVGGLDYSVTPYPRGLHMLAALVSVPDAPRSEPVLLLGYDAVLAAAMTWLAVALLLLVSVAVAVRVLDRLGSPPVVGLAASGLLAGGVLLTNTFVHSFVYAGGAASLTAVAVLQALVLLVLVARDHEHRLAAVTFGSAVAALLIAHLWQALLLGPVVLWLGCAAAELRRAASWRDRPQVRRRMGLAVAASLALVGPAAVPLLGLQQTTGLSYAAVPGDLDGPPWRVLAAGLLALGLLLVTRRRETWVLAVASLTVGLLGAVALLLRGTGHPTDLGQYYPMKAAWLLALSLAPLTAAVAAREGARLLTAAWRLLGRVGRPAYALRAALVGLLVGPGLALWTGYLVGLDSSTLIAWQKAVPSAPTERSETIQLSAVRYDVALRFGRHTDRALVPWDVGSSAFAPNGSMTTSLLLSFLTGQPEMPSGWTDVCAAITGIAEPVGRPPTVLTQYPVRAVRQEMAEKGCAGAAEIRHVPNTGYRD